MKFRLEILISVNLSQEKDFLFLKSISLCFPGGPMVKNPPANAGDPGLIPRKISWRRKWQPTPVFLPGEFHGQRSLAGYSPWDDKDWDAAAAAAKSLQSCPTLCDPIDGSPPGSPVRGTFQARTLEWVAISFSSA